MTTDVTADQKFQRLANALLPMRIGLSSLLQLYGYARLTVLILLALLGIGFIALVSGAERFPNLVPLLIPSGGVLIALIICVIVRRSIRKAARLFKMIYLESDPEYPALERLRFLLEDDGSFDQLRIAGFSVESSWRDELERVEAEQDFSRWLAAAIRS